MATPVGRPVEQHFVTERDANAMLIDQIEDLHDQIATIRAHSVSLQKHLRRERKFQLGTSLMLMALGGLSCTIVTLVLLGLASHFHRF